MPCPLCEHAARTAKQSPIRRRGIFLQDFLQQLQDSSFSVWFLGSPSIWAYPTVLTLHTVGLTLVVGPHAVLDLRLLGAAPRLPLDALRHTFGIMWWGFVLNASTGLVLFISEAADKGTLWVFYVKLLLIALAMAAAVGTRRWLRERGLQPQGTVPPGVKTLAASSLALWAGAIVAGRLMAYLH